MEPQIRSIGNERVVPTHSTSDISEQSLLGLKRELVNFSEDLYFLSYIFLPYFFYYNFQVSYCSNQPHVVVQNQSPLKTRSSASPIAPPRLFCSWAELRDGLRLKILDNNCTCKLL